MNDTSQSIRGDPDGSLGAWQWKTDWLWPWVGLYAWAVLILITAILVLGAWAFFVYLGLGWWLGRKVWREAMWLEADDGLGSTVHAEACLIITWLWSHPILMAAAWFARRN